MTLAAAHAVVRHIVATDTAPDLTARQLDVLLTVYGTQEKQTVRGLAAALRVSKPAITRALDRLGAEDLAVRRKDAADRRSVLIDRTPRGTQFVRALAKAAQVAA